VVADEVSLCTQLRVDGVGHALGVELVRVRLERLDRVAEDREIPVLEVDQVAPTSGSALGLGHNHGYLVADEPDDVGTGLRRAGAA
jgi:hypothetical protein